jgi:hypothetical protein
MGGHSKHYGPLLQEAVSTARGGGETSEEQRVSIMSRADEQSSYFSTSVFSVPSVPYVGLAQPGCPVVLQRRYAT